MDDTIKPITTELREFVANKIPVFYEMLHDEFSRLCDTIDAVDTNLARERDELHDECNWLHAELHGWETDAVKLPLDVDGVPWHIGDVTENGVVVNAMELSSHGWIFLCQNDIDPSIHRHHTPDTWERIIEDVAQFGHDDDVSHIDMAKYVARCKALAGDAK